MHTNFSSAVCEAQSNALPAERGDDLLSQILVDLRLDGVEYNRCELNGPWAVAYSAQSWARFHFVGSGGCWLRTPDADWLQLHQGDAVLLPRGSLHILASAPDVPPVDIASLARTTLCGNVHLVGPCGARRGSHLHAHHHDHGAGHAPLAATPPTVVFSGALRFNLDPLHPLLAMMPTVMQARDLTARDPAVPALLDAMEREVAFDRIGACGILARLAGGQHRQQQQHLQRLDHRRALPQDRQGDRGHPRRARTQLDRTHAGRADPCLALQLCRILHPHHGRKPGQICGQGAHVRGPALDRPGPVAHRHGGRAPGL